MRKAALCLSLLALILLMLAPAHARAQGPRVVIIWMPDYAGYSEVTADIFQLVLDRLHAMGIEPLVLDSPKAFDDYLHGGYQADDILVNLHGEVIPIPDSYATGSIEDCLAFIRALARLVVNEGVVFVNVAGIPFGRAENDLRGVRIDLGYGGIAEFLSLVNASASFPLYISQAGSVGYAKLTEEGAALASRYGLALPDEVTGIYSVSMSIEPVCLLYETGVLGYYRPFETAAIYRLGAGYYAHVGAGIEDEEVKAKIAMTLILRLRELGERGKILLIACEDAEWYGLDMDRAERALIQLLDARNLSYELVMSVDSLESALEEAPERSIIVNLHGEVIPVPSSFVETGSGLAPALRFVKWLASAVRDRGHAFINIAGRPMYSASNVKAGYRAMLGIEGFAVFVSVASNFTACGFWYDLATDRPLGALISDLGRLLVARSRADLWAGLLAPYAMSTSLPKVASLFVAYSGSEPRAAAAAVYAMGSGFFVNLGLDLRTPDRLKAEILAVLIDLLKPREVTVKVVDPTNRAPVADAEVLVMLKDGTTVAEGKTDSTGTLELTLPGGEYVIVVRKPGYAQAYRRLLLIEPTELRILLSPTLLEVRVSDALSGAPVTNATVRVFTSDGNLVAETSVGDDGVARIRLPEGMYKVRIEAEGYAAREFDQVLVQASTVLEVPLRPVSMRLRIVVVDEESGSPVAGAQVSVLSDGRLLAEGVTDEHGVFEVEVTEPGPLRVEVRRDGVLIGVGEVELNVLPREAELRVSCLPTYADEYRSLLEKYRQLRSKYASLSDEYNRLLAEYEKLLEMYRELNQSHAELQEEYSRLEREQTEMRILLNNTLLRLRVLLANYTETIEWAAGLEQAYRELQARYAELNASYSELSARYQQLQAEAENLRAEYAALLDKHKSLLASYERLRRRWPLVAALVALCGVAAGALVALAYQRWREQQLVVQA